MDINKSYTEAVNTIKEAILRSQHHAISLVNKQQLSLYYGIGRYVSENSRKESWGKGAIEQISGMLQKELPGLRGFSATNIRNMRIFYEEWDKVLNHQPVADDLPLNEKWLLAVIHQPTADVFNWTDFLSIGFSHHTEILSKTKTLEARLFYIHECATRYWSKYTLRDYLKADLYSQSGTLPNNFAQTSPNSAQAIKAVCSFKDEYLLDFINIEEFNEQTEDINERVIEKAIVANIKKFIMTFGQDFSFIGNQYRIEVAGEEMFIDLLFFNRELNSLIAVELKSGKFRTSYLGQLNTYLSALDAYIRKPIYRNNSLQGDEPLLCRICSA